MYNRTIVQCTTYVCFQRFLFAHFRVYCHVLNIQNVHGRTYRNVNGNLIRLVNAMFCICMNYGMFSMHITLAIYEPTKHWTAQTVTSCAHFILFSHNLYRKLKQMHRGVSWTTFHFGNVKIRSI